MTEPTRLLDTPESELERALLSAGRSYTASGSTRAKTLLALGLSGVATSVAPSAAAASKTVTHATLAKIAVTVLAIGAAAVPAWRYLGQSSPPPTARAVYTAVTLQALSAEPPADAPVGAAEATAPEVVPPPAVDSAAPAKAGTAANTRTEVKPPSAPPLTAELAALDAARSSLSRSDASAALAALDAYTRNFPHGRLKLEAEVLRIGALAKSGQTDAARKRAEAFLRRHPDSVLASRVRSYAGL